MARYDREAEPAWHALLEDSAALTAAIQEQLQQPARRGLVRAAQHAAVAAEEAEQTLRNSAAAVLGLLLLVSVLLTLSISVPVPVLALGGDRGFGQAPLLSMRELAENVRGGVIERCGHWIVEEQTDYLIDQLTTFFAEK